jgi:MFS family permease
MTAIADGQRQGWMSNEIVGLFCVAAAAAIGFVVSQLRPGAGLLDMSLFRNPQFASAALIALFFGCGNFATIYAFPVFSQLVQEYTATLAGFLILPGTLIAMAILPWTGRLSDRVPPQYPIIGGLIIFAISMMLMAGADTDTVVWSVGFFVFVGRLGLAFVVPSMNSVAIAALPVEKVSQGVGAINFFLLFGGACGINLLVVIMEQRTQWHSDLLAATQTAGNAATREMLSGVHGMLGETGVPEALHSPVALDFLGQVVHAQANTLGFQDGFTALALVFLLAIIPATALAWVRRRN